MTSLFKRLLTPKGIGAGSIIISLTTILSYVLGLVRDRIFAQYFGTTIFTDAYQTAFIIPDIILNICIVGALSGVFIPIFIDSLEYSQEKANKLASTFLTVMGVALVVMSIGAYMLLPQLLPLVIPADAPPEGIKAAMDLSSIMLIYPLLVGLSNTFGAILQSYHRFLSYGIASTLYNLGIILGIVLFAENLGIFAAGIGVIIGFTMHMFIRLLELRLTNFRFSFAIDLKDKDFHKILILMWPRVVTLLTLVLVLREFSFVGYTLPEGSNTAAAMARNFQSFAISVFGVAVATAALPALSRQASKKDDLNFGQTLYQTITQTLTFAIPSAVGMGFVATSLIAVVIKGGAFDNRSLAMTSTLLILFAISVPLESLMHVYSRAFYAWKKVWVPTTASIAFAVVTISTVRLLKDSIGVDSFAVAWIAGTTIQSTILIVWLHLTHKKSNAAFTKLPTFLTKLIGLNVLMASILYGIGLLQLSNPVHLVVAVIVSAVVYLGLGSVIRLEGLDRVLGLFQKKRI